MVLTIVLVAYEVMASVTGAEEMNDQAMGSQALGPNVGESHSRALAKSTISALPAGELLSRVHGSE